MTIWELVIVLWLFCAIIGGTAVFSYVHEQDALKGQWREIPLLMLFSTFIGLLTGPFLIGNIFAGLHNKLEPRVKTSEGQEPDTQN